MTGRIAPAGRAIKHKKWTCDALSRSLWLLKSREAQLRFAGAMEQRHGRTCPPRQLRVRREVGEYEMIGLLLSVELRLEGPRISPSHPGDAGDRQIE